VKHQEVSRRGRQAIKYSRDSDLYASAGYGVDESVGPRDHFELTLIFTVSRLLHPQSKNRLGKLAESDANEEVQLTPSVFTSKRLRTSSSRTPRPPLG
jgi:hypothetical protein